MHACFVFPVTLVLAIQVAPAISPETKAPTVDHAVMEDLLRKYRDYGLPFPPDNAVLVRFPNGSSTQEKSGRHTPFYALGFWLNQKSPGAPAEILVGPFRHKLEIVGRHQEQPEVFDLKSTSFVRVDFDWRGEFEPYPINVGLATAIQCEARGLGDLAESIAKESVKDGWGGGPNLVSSGGPWVDPTTFQVSFDQSSTAPLALTLAGLAWNHWLNEIGRIGSDWREIVSRMDHLLEAEPQIANQGRRAVVGSIHAALQPRTSTPGTPESLIDDLVDLARQSWPYQMYPADKAFAQLKELGFEAVPALIAHLDDERMTRSITPQFNNFRPRPRRIDDLVGEILQPIAGEDLGKDWLAVQIGWHLSKADALVWWNKAQKIGEERYAVAHVIPKKGADPNPNEVLLDIIRRKYPQQLPALYRTAIHGKNSSQSLAAAVAKSDLSDADKRKLLAAGLGSRSFDHQTSALAALQSIDPSAAERQLIERLSKLPKYVTGPLWTSPEGRLAGLAKDSNSPEVWEALLGAAKRARVGLRMELIHETSSIDVDAPTRTQLLAFLTAFLDDETSRDLKSDKKLYQGPCAGFQFPHLSVQNLAAIELAEVFNVPDEPEPDWRPEEWKAFRAKVRAAMEQLP